jgi:hypothetical protein
MHSAASVRCFAFEDGAELPPRRIADALGEVAVAYHIRDPQIFEIDDVVLPEQRQCRLVMEVAPLALYLLVLARQPPDRLRPPMAAARTPGNVALRLHQ